MAVYEKSQAPSRRHLVASALAVPVLAMGPEPEAGGAEDRACSLILPLFHQHAALRLALEHSTNDAQADQIVTAMQALAGQIMSLPSGSAADFAAKLLVDSSYGDLFSDWDAGALWIEARALTGMAL